MKFSTKTRKSRHQQKQQPPREDEEIISISYSDMYTNSTMGDPAYDMEMIQETQNCCFPAFEEETQTSCPTDVQSIIRNHRCTSEEFDVVFRQVGEETAPQKPTNRFFQLLASPTSRSSSSSETPPPEEDEPSCFGSKWEIAVWSISAVFVISVTVVLCALLYTRRLGNNSTVQSPPPEWNSALPSATMSPTSGHGR